MFTIYIFVFAFGAIFGSFLNVLIYRLPLSRDVIFARSACPVCNKTIRWFENIPIFSYLFLRGKCLGCKSKISVQYPLVELFMGIVAIILFPSYMTSENLLIFIFFFSIACCFVVHFIVDLRHQILPDEITIYLACIFLPYAIWSHSWHHWVLGPIVGIAIPAVVTYLFYLIKGQIGMGMGDIKLYGALGILLGPFQIINTLVLSSLLGSIVGIILIVSKLISKDKPIAFGPFILISATLQIFLPNFIRKLPLLF